MKKLEVLFQGGESLEKAGAAATFMMVSFKGTDYEYEFDKEMLYSEFTIPDEMTLQEEEDLLYIEGGTYDTLKAEIIRQAKELGIDAGMLDFPE